MVDITYSFVSTTFSIANGFIFVFALTFAIATTIRMNQIKIGPPDCDFGPPDCVRGGRDLRPEEYIQAVIDYMLTIIHAAAILAICFESNVFLQIYILIYTIV